MTPLCDHFTLEELTASQWAARMGVDNTPPPDALERLRVTAKGMEQVRARLGDRAILVSSGYRSRLVNAAIGGAVNSAHVLGYAVDFTCPSFGSPFDVARHLSIHLDLSFDQLIYEFRSWVHISFDPRGRRDLLTIRSNREGYLRGIIAMPELP